MGKLLAQMDWRPGTQYLIPDIVWHFPLSACRGCIMAQQGFERVSVLEKIGLMQALPGVSI